MARALAALALVLGLASCTDGDDRDTTSVISPATSAATTASKTEVPPSTAPPSLPAGIKIELRIERLVSDDATASFAAFVTETLLDERGWTRAGFGFAFRDDAPYTIVLAEGPEVDARCSPYDTAGRYSCQRGPVVAINADRWRTATPKWTGDLSSYRKMLINHEVGHLLGQHHPTGGCATPGAPAPVMVQQSTNLDGCLANPWPLDWEIACARAGLEPLAPPYEEDAKPLCGPDGLES